MRPEAFSFLNSEVSMKFTNKILGFLVVAMFVAMPSFAQTGNVHGKVVDETGKPAAGVTISIDRQAIPQHFEVKTDENGSYLHAGLPTGQYLISVLKDDKKVMTLPPVTVRFGGDTAADFDLKFAGVGPRGTACEKLRRSDPPLQGSFR